MKNIQILILLMFSIVLYQCQKKEMYYGQNTEKNSLKHRKNNDSIILNLGTDIFPADVDYMKLYKYDARNDCEQSKAVSIIYNEQLSVCFNYIRIIKGKKMVDFLATIKNIETYGAEDVACFNTDYSIILYNKKNEVIGYINISFDCNKLISNPEIKETEFYSQNGLRKVGFSKKGREKIKQILGI